MQNCCRERRTAVCCLLCGLDLVTLHADSGMRLTKLQSARIHFSPFPCWSMKPFGRAQSAPQSPLWEPEQQAFFRKMDRLKRI